MGKIRDLGYLEWENDKAWLEEQKGSKWDSRIEKENKKFKKALEKVNVHYKEHSPSSIHLKGWSIQQVPFTPQQIWKHKGIQVKCWDADISEDLFVGAVQDSKGFERFHVELHDLTNSKHLKTLEKTGPTVAILDSTVYFLGSEADLRYNTLKKWTHGSDEETLYTLEDLTQNLEIKRGEDKSVYLIKSDFTKRQYNRLPKLETWLDEPHRESCIVSDNLKIEGIEDTIEALSLKAKWIVTRSKGIRTLWNKTKMKPVTYVWGDISFDERNPFNIEISDIRYEPYTIHLPKWTLTNPKPHLFPCSYHHDPLPAFVVHPQDILNIRGLLITTYGAYGTPTHVGNLISRWKPLLEKGWIIASVMVPGSGDHNTKWIRSGQRLNRLDAIKAFQESIEALKEEYGIDSHKTALYGRSAGGLIVSSVAILNPGLVGALYLESPYVDVLRTITNPDLPLTTLETSEFGSLNSPTNILATASWSPMEHIPVGGIPQLFVVARTDLADLEVYPYEVLKFIQRIRSSNDKDKLVYIHEDRGHFTTTWKSRAEDLALLDNWLEHSPGQDVLKKSATRTKNHAPKYKMAMTRNRKNRASRKNRDRKNRASRKNRNNAPMMGGKRHRKGSRKGSRKH